MPAQRRRDTEPHTLVLNTNSTAEQSAPVLNIIAPTPRAFTFPATHNLSIPSPCSTPSHSPFEPELRSYAGSSECSTSILSFPPPRTLSPQSSASTSPSPSKRRKSSDVDRRPKRGDDDYIKRPENAFILFRRKCTSQSTARSTTGKKARQADLSKTISQQWKSLAADEKKYWEELAKEKKKEHEELYPNYVYRPQRVKARSQSHSKVPATRPTKTEPAVTAEATSEPVTFSIPLYPQQSGRSSSVPAQQAAGYQHLSIPNVYSTSCSDLPCSPAEDERRGSYDSNYSDDSLQFDNQYNQYEMPEYMTNMFTSNPQPTLSLDIPTYQQSSLFMSPASSSGPLTPSSSMSHADWSFTHDRRTSCSSDMSMGDVDLQMGLQLQQQEPTADEYSQYTNWDSSSWDNAPSSSFGLGVNDFDLSSVQPVELGAGWDSGDSTKLSGPLSFDYVSGSYDDMLSVHHQHSFSQ